MTAVTLEQLKYPIGKFVAPATYSAEFISECISEIEKFPSLLKKEVSNLSDEQLDTPYRPEGWTIRQVVHHCADSHMNGLTRFKLTLTEDLPTIKPYRENLFAELADTLTMGIPPSLIAIEGIHARWAVLLKSLNDTHFHRKYIHPEYKKEFSLHEATALYSWHCKHHLAHITSLKKT
ncbi:MAG: putative metal-dependent hydrolase, partial [Bacteroidetes bacterium]|nr:putative metal-dependent hydrolase [Bacteroidota bacterium]